MAYCTQPDLELAVGGTAKLVQLLDKDGDRIADPAMVSAVLDRATSEIDASLQVRHQLPLTSTPAFITTLCASLGAYYAYHMGSGGQGVPAGVRQLYEDAQQHLSDLARGLRTVGAVDKPTTDMLVKQVDTNADSAGESRGRVTRDSLKGLW